MIESGSKASLRAAVLAARRALKPEERAARSDAIARRLLTVEPYARAHVIGLYSAIGAEVDTGSIARHALQAGKRLAYPRVDATGRTLGFARCDPAHLVAGPHRTTEPPPGSPPVPLEVLDLVLVPGVAFDPLCRRLGRGRGHYDATLAALPAATPRFGLAFDLQIVPAVPEEPHDVPLDAVVTESRVLLRPPVGGSAPSSR